MNAIALLEHDHERLPFSKHEPMPERGAARSPVGKVELGDSGRAPRPAASRLSAGSASPHA